MSRLRTVMEWALILAATGTVAWLFLTVVLGMNMGIPSVMPSGLPDATGGFYQTALPAPEQYRASAAGWDFTFTSRYAYTLAGRVIGREEYPKTMPDGIMPLDISVANGEVMRPDILSYFTFVNGDRTLEYSYRLPTYYGLTEQYIDEHVSNNHLVFSDADTERAVRGAQIGSCIVIEGRLIDIRGSSREKLYSVDTSTVRNDSYPKGCEIILVQSYRQVGCGS